MTVRDAGRVKIKAPNIDVDANGSASNDNNSQFVCVTGNVSWSGFKRQSINTTCTNSTVDGWGNIIKTFQAGKFIDMGTLTFDVDWNPSTTDIVNAAFRMTSNGNWKVYFPAETGETAGPIITIPGHMTDMTPHTEAMAEGDNARSRATMVLKLSGDWTITNST